MSAAMHASSKSRERVETALSKLRCGLELEALETKALALEIEVWRAAGTAAATLLDEAAMGSLHPIVARQAAEQLRGLARTT